MMRHGIVAAVATVAVFAGSAAGFAGLSPTTCDELAKPPGTTRANGWEPLPRRDAVVFDHTKGQLVWPNPAKLLVRDGDVFVIVFTGTDSTRFDYALTPLGPDLIARGVDLKADSQSISTIRNDTVCVSWRFDRSSPLYRVSVMRRAPAAAPSLDPAARLDRIADVTSGWPSVEARRLATLSRKGAATSDSDVDSLEQMVRSEPNETDQMAMSLIENLRTQLETPRDLFSYTFPVWVEASDSTMSFSSGFGFSRVVNDRYFVKKDTKGTTDANDDTETVEKDAGKQDAFRPDLMVFATLTAPRVFGTSDPAKSWRGDRAGEKWWSGRVGLTFGVGIGNDSEPRYFFGPSLFLGRQLLMTVGAFGGKVDRLPAGQELGKAPVSGANTLAQLGSRFETGVGIGFAWTFGGNERKNFIKALNPPQASLEPAAPATPAAVPGKVTKVEVEDSGGKCQVKWLKPDGAEVTEYVIYKVGEAEPLGTTKEPLFKFKSAVAKDTEVQVAARNAAGEAERSDKAKVGNSCTPTP